MYTDFSNVCVSVGANAYMYMYYVGANAYMYMYYVLCVMYYVLCLVCCVLCIVYCVYVCVYVYVYMKKNKRFCAEFPEGVPRLEDFIANRVWVDTEFTGKLGFEVTLNMLAMSWRRHGGIRVPDVPWSFRSGCDKLPASRALMIQSDVRCCFGDPVCMCV